MISNINEEESSTWCANKEEPLTLEILAKVYGFPKERPKYNLVVAPEEIIKNLTVSLPHATHIGTVFGIPIIKLPEIKRKGLFRYRLFRMLFSSTKKIIEEWRWNSKIYLVSQEYLQNSVCIKNFRV